MSMFLFCLFFFFSFFFLFSFFHYFLLAHSDNRLFDRHCIISETITYTTLIVLRILSPIIPSITQLIPKQASVVGLSQLREPRFPGGAKLRKKSCSGGQEEKRESVCDEGQLRRVSGEPGGQTMIMAEVVCSSCCDPRHPPANALDERTGNFWITTGMFPQMLVLKLQNNKNNDEPVDIERIKTFSSNVAKLVVESSSSNKPESFERLFEVGTLN